MIDAEYLQKRLTFGFLVMVSFMGAKRSENPLAFVALLCVIKLGNCILINHLTCTGEFSFYWICCIITYGLFFVKE